MEVLAALKRHMNPQTQNLFPKWDMIAKELGLSRTTVFRAMRYLLKEGLIRRESLPAMNPTLPGPVSHLVITIPDRPEPPGTSRRSS